MSLRFLLSLHLLPIVGLLSAELRAARVHHLTPRDLVVDGSERDIQPGDTLRLDAGTYPFLHFRNLHGTAAQPVTITNAAGGRVRIGSLDARHAVHFSHSTHFVFRGDGDPSFSHGIEIFATQPKGGVGVQVNDLSSDFELSHLEIHGAGFAGIMAKTDPRCDDSIGRGAFVQRGTHIHHNHIHDVGGEGLYIGHSFHSGWSHDCDGDPATPPAIHFPHTLEGVRIHDNLIERTGWDGLQVGSATRDCEITANTINRTGLRGVRYQQNGIQIGDGTTGRCSDNRITDAGSQGIILLGIGDHLISGNQIIRPHSFGLFADNRPATVPDSPIHITRNTIDSPGRGGFFIMNEISSVVLDHNRLVLAPGLPDLLLGDEARPDWLNNTVE